MRAGCTCMRGDYCRHALGVVTAVTMQMQLAALAGRKKHLRRARCRRARGARRASRPAGPPGRRSRPGCARAAAASCARMHSSAARLAGLQAVHGCKGPPLACPALRAWRLQQCIPWAQGYSAVRPVLRCAPPAGAGLTVVGIRSPCHAVHAVLPAGRCQQRGCSCWRGTLAVSWARSCCRAGRWQRMIPVGQH